MWWGLFVSTLIVVTLVTQIVVLYYGRKGRKATERMIKSNERTHARMLDTLTEARAAANAAFDIHRKVAAQAAEVDEMRDQCSEVLRDVRALRGWPTDTANELHRHPGPTPPVDGLPE